MNKTSCKKFAVGLLSGAIILAGSAMLMDTVQAAESVSQSVQVQEQHYSFVAKRIAEYGNLEEAVALQLLKDGYRGRDIEMAGRLAKASGKDVQAVLAMKKINNRWYDVADALGVAWDDIRAQGGPQDLCGRGRAFHGHGGPRHGWQNDGPGMQGAGGYRGYHYDGQRPCEPQRN